MFTIDLDPKRSQIKSIHFIGIGGTSMSGIAELLFDKGFTVTGSDREEGSYTQHLQNKGIPIVFGQKAENIQDQDLFVYTDAIPESNPELKAARATGRPVVSRGRVLGAIMRNYTHSIAISGAHGKSTTTSMMAEILMAAEDRDPTILIGGALDEMGGNCRTGDGNIFLAEGCEYKGNILFYYPSIAVVLNIDADHLDYFKDLDDIIHTFERYMENIPQDGLAVLNLDDPYSRTLKDFVKGRVAFFSMTNPEADVHVENIVYSDLGQPSFSLVFKDGTRLDMQLGVLGDFNIRHAMAASLAAREAGLSLDIIKKGLEAYRSLHRRMEDMGTFHGARVLTDYGHHPAEIQATLETIHPHVKGRFYCVFEPHTYSRTRTLMADFAKTFGDCDEAVITKIYGAREEDDGSVRSEELVEKVQAHGDRAVYQETYQDVVDYLKNKVTPDDLILTTGCGKADEIARLLVAQGK